MAWPSVSSFNCKIFDGFNFDFPNLWQDRLNIDWLVTTVLATANKIIIIIIIIYLLTAIGLSPGGSGYFTCKQNMKLVTTKFKSGGLHEKHVVATWNVGNRLSVCL